LYLDRIETKPIPIMTFDYIIVGAGSAGCVLANRLSADPGVSVLLLEAGGPDKKLEIHIPAAYSKLNRTEVDWAFWTEPQASMNGRRMYQPRGKVLGGSSSTNAMAYVRGNRTDYDEWAALGNPGWNYDAVLPYFLRSEHNEQAGLLDAGYHGTNGPLNVTFAQKFRTPMADAFVEACVENGIRRNPDYNGREQIGAGLFQFTIKNGARHSAATAFLKPAMSRPNLTVITRAHTSRVLLQNGRATGVEFLTGKNQTQQATAKREVILSAGAFQSPQLLLLSGIGPADALKPHGIALKHELPGVGQNLKDHLFVGASSLCSQRGAGSNYHLKPLNQLRALGTYLFSKGGPLTTSPLEANAFYHTDDPATAKPGGPVNMQLHFAPVHLGDGPNADFYDVNTFPFTDGYTILATLLKPESTGHISLRSANPTDAPMIQPHYFQAEADKTTIIKGLRRAIEIMQGDAFGALRKDLYFPADRSSDDTLWQHVQRWVETVYHPVGTCRMGTDELAVVDAELRVRGIEGLRVADASVMPTIPSGNTNAPVIMVAERAADLILGKVQAAPAGSVKRSRTTV
jgi:choline dehydrogenase